MPEKISLHATDGDLLAQVAHGSLDAFAAFYDRLSGPLYGLCLRMTGDGGEAEEILQDAFQCIRRKARTYDPARSSVFGWAVHLTRCKVIDHLRRRSRRPRVLCPALDESSDDFGPVRALAAQVATMSTASDNAQQNDRAARVRRNLDALPAEQRQAIELAFFGDLSHHEISARLAQPLGTIKARIRCGLLKLRDGLGGVDHPPSIGIR